MSEATPAAGGGVTTPPIAPAANDATPDSSRNGVHRADAGGLGVTIDVLKEAMHSAGYRVEVHTANGMSVLRSATGGLAFDIRLANRLAGSSDRYADVAFVALLTVQGTFPQLLLNDWNRTRRFGRLYLDTMAANQMFLILCMDIVPTPDTTPQRLRTHIDIWDALVLQLVAWLNTELGRLKPDAAAASTSPAAGSGGADALAPGEPT